MNNLTPMSRVPAEISQVDPTLHVLERLMRDPSIPIERIERVVAMIDGREMQQAKRSFSSAMALAQEEMRSIATDCINPQTRTRYASLGAVDRAIRPIYSKHGLFPSFNTGPSEQGPEWVKVLCEVAHRDGYSREYSIDMPADGKGARGNDVMTKTHATGSAVTYGRRYLLMMIFNLSVEDDDGNAASKKTNGNGNGNGHLSDEQIDGLRSAIVDAGADIGRFCKMYGIQRVEDLPARKLSEAMTKLAKFKKQEQEKQAGGQS